LHLFTQQHVQERLVSRILNVSIHACFESSVQAVQQFSVCCKLPLKKSYTVRKEVVFRVVVLLLQHVPVAESATFRR